MSTAMSRIFNNIRGWYSLATVNNQPCSKHCRRWKETEVDYVQFKGSINCPFNGFSRMLNELFTTIQDCWRNGLEDRTTDTLGEFRTARGIHCFSLREMIAEIEPNWILGNHLLGTLYLTLEFICKCASIHGSVWAIHNAKPRSFQSSFSYRKSRFIEFPWCKDYGDNAKTIVLIVAIFMALIHDY